MLDTTPSSAGPGGAGSGPRRRAPRGPAWWRRIARAERRRARQRRTRSWLWRLGTPAAFAAAGTLLVTSHINAAGTDLRAGRLDSLADVVREQSARLQELRQEASALSDEVEQLSTGLDDDALTLEQARLDALRDPAGMTPVEGPGVTVVLDDAPASIRETAGESVKDAIVHQQDIQAVANVLWAGGAEAMTLQDQRVVSTTGIKCVGNTVILHGVPYSPPYRISAIGDTASMLRALEASPYVQAYLQDVDTWQLGWDVSLQGQLQLPGYEGPLDLRYAEPAPSAS